MRELILAMSSGILHHAIYDYLCSRYIYRNKLTFALFLVITFVNTVILIYLLKGL